MPATANSLPASTGTPPPPCAHLLLPWATSLAESAQRALPQLDDPQRLPRLHTLLGLLAEHSRCGSDEYTLSPPHEVAWARLLGWPEAPDGCLPWAAHLAQKDGLITQERPPKPADEATAWGLLTPCHWLMGRDHLTVLHPDMLALSEAESRELFEAVRPLFTGEGWQLHWGAPTRWYACHPSLAHLPTASLDRVLGRNPDVWMPEHPQARLVRRLQAEVQMLLYQHPVNDARSAQGTLSVNSFWLSGCGVAQPGTPVPGLEVIDAPRQALLHGDLPAWLAAWEHLERSHWPALIDALRAGQPVRLTLCGERHAITLAPRPAGEGGWWQRLGKTLGLGRAQMAVKPSALLGSL